MSGQKAIELFPTRDPVVVGPPVKTTSNHLQALTDRRRADSTTMVDRLVS